MGGGELFNTAPESLGVTGAKWSPWCSLAQRSRDLAQSWLSVLTAEGMIMSIRGSPHLQEKHLDSLIRAQAEAGAGGFVCCQMVPRNSSSRLFNADGRMNIAGPAWTSSWHNDATREPVVQLHQPDG